MILEAAILNVKPGKETVFENAFREAKPIDLAAIPVQNYDGRSL